MFICSAEACLRERGAQSQNLSSARNLVGGWNGLNVDRMLIISVLYSVAVNRDLQLYTVLYHLFAPCGALVEKKKRKIGLCVLVWQLCLVFVTPQPPTNLPTLASVTVSMIKDVGGCWRSS
jgi:hypothetical protein